jgi:hypothetical protein
MASLFGMMLMFNWHYLQGGPGDLASLVQPQAVLQRMEVQTTDEALLGLLRSQRKKPGEDDKKDMDYLHRLMAIRLLESRKSTDTLPVLKEIARGKDPTLAQAAREAIAVIKGRPLPRPAKAETMQWFAEHIRRDAGFVILTDLSRTTRGPILPEAAQKIVEASPFGEAIKAVTRNMGEKYQEQLTEAETKMAAALARVGNDRADGIAVTVPPGGKTPKLLKPFVPAVNAPAGSEQDEDMGTTAAPFPSRIARRARARPAPKRHAGTWSPPGRCEASGHPTGPFVLRHSDQSGPLTRKTRKAFCEE